MVIFKNLSKRASYAVTALTLAFGATVPALLMSGFANAANQATVRSIQIGDSNASASTSYLVTFKAATSTTIAGIVVDICDDSPIIGSTTCTMPAGFSWGAPGSLTGNFTNGNLPVVTNTWTTSGIQAGAPGGSSQVYELSNTTAQSLVANTSYNFTVGSVTNPSTANHSYYARILTFDTTAHMTGEYTTTGTARAASFADNKDYGGIALSTGTVIGITAKVQETLSFCVYDASGSCGTAPTFQIGAGANGTLDTTLATHDVKFDVSTNANGNGASASTTINLRGATLTSGSNTIPAAGSSPATLSSGTGGFGLYVQTAGSGVTKAATYNGGSGTQYGFNSAAAGGTYGDPVATIIGPVSASTTTLRFGAIASATTPAGLYTANEQLVATGTF